MTDILRNQTHDSLPIEDLRPGFLSLDARVPFDNEAAARDRIRRQEAATALGDTVMAQVAALNKTPPYSGGAFPYGIM